MHFQTMWSPGMWAFVIATPIAALLIILSTAVAALAIAKHWYNAILAGVGCLLVLGAITLWAMWPLKMTYHEYRPVSGIVQSTSSRFLSDGQGNVNQRIAVVIGGQVYGCDDTRCSLLKKGDPVTLLCKSEYEQNGTPGDVCNFGANSLNR